MGLVCRGVTHCNECGSALGNNEYGRCDSCKSKDGLKLKNKTEKELKHLLQEFNFILANFNSFSFIFNFALFSL